MTKEKTHKHKCPECSFIWEHEDDCVNNTLAHTCRCGTQVWHWDNYNEPAVYISCATLPPIGSAENPLPKPRGAEEFFAMIDRLITERKS